MYGSQTVSRTPPPVDRHAMTVLLILFVATVDIGGTLTFVTSLAGPEPAVVIAASSVAPVLPAAVGILFYL